MDSIKENTEIVTLGNFQNDRDIIEQSKPVSIKEFLKI